MPLTTQTQPVPLERLTYRSSVPFSAAESRLRSSIQKQAPPNSTFLFSNNSWSSRPTSREEFTAMTTPQLGPHGFMYFSEFNHGSWLPFYEPPTSTITDGGKTKHLQAIRFILGNPLIAITMLQHDLDAGLCVPVELYLVEERNGGSRIVWYRPSGLVAGYEGAKEELVDAGRILDGKLEALVKWVLREDGEAQEKL